MGILAQRVSRRLFGKSFVGASLCGIVARPVRGALDNAPVANLPAAPTRSERHYRADAQILLFGAPIFRRNGVGAGHAAWTEGGAGKRRLEFTGYSIPERAAGLNRLGFIQEDSHSRNEFTYFGLMTSSPEESMDSARKALRPATGDAAFTAIDGRLDTGKFDALVAHFVAPAAASVQNREDLVRSARSALGSERLKPLEFDPRTAAAQPFLHSLFDALRQGRDSTTYVYGSRHYSLTLRSAPDQAAAAAFRQAGRLSAGAGVTRVSARIRPSTGGKDSEFRIWVPSGEERPIPLRIEYRPKSYLRLIFEAV